MGWGLVWLWMEICPSSSILFGSQRATMKREIRIKCVYIASLIPAREPAKPRFPMTSRFFILCAWPSLHRQKEKRKRKRNGIAILRIFFFKYTSYTTMYYTQKYSSFYFYFYFFSLLYFAFSGTNRRRGNNPSLIILDTPPKTPFSVFCFVS